MTETCFGIEYGKDRPDWLIRYDLYQWLTLWVWKDWTVWSDESVWAHPSWKGVCKKKWRQISFADNGNWYKFTNISWRSVWKKHICITQHRLVYAAYNGLDYWGDYTVWHLNNDSWDNTLDNLYWIFWTWQAKQSTEHKKSAYKLLELVMRWDIELSNEHKQLVFLS
jgi:hypothetical protein